MADLSEHSVHFYGVHRSSMSPLACELLFDGERMDECVMMVCGGDSRNRLMDENAETENDGRQCQYCRHFHGKEYTGYCQLHHMFVLKSFVCSKFWHVSDDHADRNLDSE